MLPAVVLVSVPALSVNVSEGVNGLPDGMVRSFNATDRGGNGSISEIPANELDGGREQWNKTRRTGRR